MPQLAGKEEKIIINTVLALTVIFHRELDLGESMMNGEEVACKQWKSPSLPFVMVKQNRGNIHRPS